MTFITDENVAVWMLCVGGFIARVAHVALTTAVMKTMTSVIYERFES